MIHIMSLTKSEARELFDAYVATLGPNAAAYAERSHVPVPDVADSFDVQQQQVRAAASWFMDHLRTGSGAPPVSFPVWWDPDTEASPFTPWQLEVIDQFIAWYWLASEASLPDAERVVRKESRLNWKNQEPALEITPRRYLSPLGIVYVWALRLLRGENEDPDYIVDVFSDVKADVPPAGAPVADPAADAPRSPGKITKRSERYDGLREVSWHVDSDDDLRCVDVVWSSDPEDRRWQVDVAAAEYIRGGELEAVLEDTVTQALLGVRGVRSAVREGTESWFVEGNPSGRSLARSVSNALEPLIPRLMAALED